jgi:hypothetical protein
MSDPLDKKTVEELKEMIEAQDTRIKGLEADIKKNKRSNSSTLTDGDSDVSAFSLNPVTNLEKIKTGFESVVTGFKNSINIFDETIFKQLDEYSTEVQSSFGLSKSRISEFRSVIAETAPELIKMGLSSSDASTSMIEAMEGLKTSASLSSKTIIELAATTQVTGVSVKELSEDFRGVGISIQSVGKEMNTVVDYARSVGISVKGISKDVTENIGKLNLFNFDNGVVGLAKMSENSQRFGIEMRETFTIAEKLLSPESAINLAAGLQRLGVASNGLLDPLRAMDMAQNDPEALQQEIVNLSKEFTTFNEKTGKMEILPGGKRRLREIAAELDIDAGAFAKMSIQAADFDRKLKQIKMPALAEGDEETKKLIASMAQLDSSGVAKIMVKNEETGFITEKNVDELTDTDIKNLQKANEESSKSIEEIAINQLDETKQINAFLNSGKIAGAYALATAPSIEKLGYFVSRTTKSLASRYSNEMGSVSDIRKKQEGVARPIEDFTKAFVAGDDKLMGEATKSFAIGMDNVVSSFFKGAETYVKDVFNDVSGDLSKTYGNESKTVTVQGTIILEGKGDVNGNGILDINKPNEKQIVLDILDGKKEVSAATGSKY